MLRYILLTLSVILLAGCSLIYEYHDTPRPVAEESADTLCLSFHMIVPIEEKSRLDNGNHSEIDSENPTLEDRIYADDFCFFIFAGLKGDANPAYVTRVYNGSGSNDPNTMISGGPIDYIVKVSIPIKDFEKVVPTGNDLIFKVVSVANTNKEFINLTAEKYSDYNSLIAAASEWNFNIFGTLYVDKNGGLAQRPRIPMFGTVTFDVKRLSLYESTSVAPVWGDNISMLRSLAKVKVIDNIPLKESEVYPRVESVSFNTRGMAYILPDDAANYSNGYQVETARPCPDEIGPRDLALQGHTDENIWTGYVPEQAITGAGVMSNYPFFRITIANLRADNTVENLVYDVPMSSYSGSEFNYGTSILRNHIYTLIVNGFGTTLDCEVVLVPYRSCVLDPYFGLDR